MNGHNDTNGHTEGIKEKPALQPLQLNGNYSDIPDTNSPISEKRTVDEKVIEHEFDEIIPHLDEVHHRNLILCFDGTGDQFDGDVCRYCTIHGSFI